MLPPAPALLPLTIRQIHSSEYWSPAQLGEGGCWCAASRGTSAPRAASPAQRRGAALDALILECLVDLDLKAIVDELNQRAARYRIGSLQRLRQQLRGHQRLAGTKLFSMQTTFARYAFHHGGRSELQFNIGLEPTDAPSWLRHGVAFSLEPSQALPTIEPLVPTIERFNQYLRLYGNELADFRMWHFVNDVRSEDSTPSPVPHELVHNSVFIFLGTRQRAASPDLDVILQDFDRLLPLYAYVEGSASTFPVQSVDSQGLKFEPGCSLKKPGASVALPVQRLDIVLRHNQIQREVHDILAAQHAPESVGTENLTGTGNRVDVVVRRTRAHASISVLGATKAN